MIGEREERRRIACFFTAGYTELNAMKSFMKKINDAVEYIQLCPTGPRKSKRAIENRHIDQISKNQNGMTGESLIHFVLDFIKRKRFEEEGYDAILIEDDKDDRFLLLEKDGTAVIDKGQWECFKEETVARLRKVCPGIPVMFFYAAPEIEAWFLADWENSFGSVYKNVLNAQKNHHFSVVFRRHINDNILTDRYRNCIEEYGYFGGKYKKLSGEIQSALEEIDFCGFGEEHPRIAYSKRKEGGYMLEKINPETVFQNCKNFFKDGYLILQTF